MIACFVKPVIELMLVTLRGRMFSSLPLTCPAMSVTWAKRNLFAFICYNHTTFVTMCKYGWQAVSGAQTMSSKRN